MLSLLAEDDSYTIPSNLGHVGRFSNSPSWLRGVRKALNPKTLVEVQTEPQTPSASYTNQTSRQLAYSAPPQASLRFELSFSIPPRQIFLWKQWHAVQVGLTGSGMGNSACPHNPALNKVSGSIINKMAVCLHIFLIDFPLPFAQAAQVSPDPPSCSANTGQMERDSPSRLLAPTFVMSSGPSSFLPATSPNHSLQPPLQPERILPLSELNSWDFSSAGCSGTKQT